MYLDELGAQRTARPVKQDPKQRRRGLRILLVAHAFPPTFGGVETHLWDLSHCLARRGHRVHCLVGGEESEERFHEVTVTRRPSLSVGHLIRQRDQVEPTQLAESLLSNLTSIATEAVESFAPDVVHLHNAHHFAPELAAAFFRLGVRRPLLNSVHDRVGEHLYPAVLGYSWQHTIFASHYLRQSLPEAAGAQAVLWLGIDLSHFSPHGESDPRLLALEPPVVFHPARLLRWKGVEVGLLAFLDLRRELGRGSLVLCGSTAIVDDPGEIIALRSHLQEIARSAGMADSVHFLEFERAGMPAAYRASTLVWYPTIDEEPLGLVPLEAMACGAALVVSNSGGMRETVLPGKTGLVVPKNDPYALAASAKSLIVDRALRERLVSAGLKHSQRFDVESYTTRLEQIYWLNVGERHDHSELES